jgi:hypothetical protein
MVTRATDPRARKSRPADDRVISDDLHGVVHADRAVTMTVTVRARLVARVVVANIDIIVEEPPPTTTMQACNTMIGRRVARTVAETMVERAAAAVITMQTV